MVALLARTLLVVALSLLLWSLVPAAFGMTSTTVMSGSMAPSIQVGDEVVSAPTLPAQLHTGQVLLVDDPDHPGRLRLHRFATVRGDELVLRGDANAQNDSSPIAESAIRGVAFLRVPYAGLPMYWARTGQWGAEAGFVLIAGALVLLIRADRLLEPARRRGSHAEERARTADERRRGRHARSLDRPAWWPRAPRGRHLAAGASSATAAVVTVLMVLGAGLHDSHPAMSTFSAVSATSSSTFAAASAFPCLVRTAPAGLAAAPNVWYSFAEPTGSTTSNLSAAGSNDGVFTGSVSHVAGTCGSNASPAIAVGGSGAGCVTVPTPLTSPSIFTVAIWFKTSTGGGLIAGFGSKGDGTASSTFDRQLTMNANGTLTFRVLNAIGSTSSITTPSGYADNQWHQAIVSLTALGPMTIVVDGSVVASATLSLALSAYTGYWRFGYDATPSSTTAYFTGQLDEAEVFNGLSLSTGDVTKLLNAGH